MDHEAVVRDKITEKYLLKELAPKLQNEFEEHYFDCPECARDVGAADEFVERSKLVLTEEPAPVVNRNATKAGQGWFAWFRPAFAAAVIAILAVVVGYQNLVTLPGLKGAINTPMVLPAATVNLLTYGSNAAPLAVRTGEAFLINVIIPPDRRYTGYKVDLYNPAGAVEASVAIPVSAQDTWPIRFPGTNRQSGTYKLKVYGTTTNGPDVEVGGGSFELQIQK